MRRQSFNIVLQKIYFVLVLYICIIAIKDGELSLVRKNPNKFGPWVLFCSIPTMKCKHFFVLLLQNLSN